ncbi:hypothetical protein CEQ90_18640 [Lewinellaceae bacterium SD302]|nr:hypothetical protein CEQ90_18640 [Lewinellaceae bacterium SD302]
MFGSSKDTKDTSPAKSNSGRTGGTPSRGLNTVNEGTVMTGDLVADSDIRIDGTINGDLKCKAKVIIGPKGSIKGTVNCDSAVIEGKFDGRLEVRESLVIKETADIIGDVVTKNIAMSSGASFDGTLSTKTSKVNSNGSDKVASLKQKERVKA